MPATIRKMASVTPRTSIERSKIECAGVAAGAKMFVGDCALTGFSTRAAVHTRVLMAQSKLKLRVPPTVFSLGK
jgi:hypothetical protein